MMKAHAPLALALWLLILLIVSIDHFALAASAPAAVPNQVAYEHYIRLKVVKVTPVERTDRTQLLKLEVKRWYGKIEKRSLERAQQHETQRFAILFPASPDAVVQAGDIIDYRIVRYSVGPLELGPSKSDVMPEPDVFYALITPPMLFETRRPGPKEQKSSQAWAVANEFVFRTALRGMVVLPASGVTPGRTGYLVRFDGKEDTADLQVFVRGDLKAAKWIKE
jgi:hypothetical protein